MTNREDVDFSRLADILPPGYIPLGYAASIKALDEDGDVVLVNYYSDDLNIWEAVGMLTSATDDLRARMREGDDD